MASCLGHVKEITVDREFGKLTKEDFVKKYPFVNVKKVPMRNQAIQCAFCKCEYPSEKHLTQHQKTNTCTICKRCFSYRTKNSLGVLNIHMTLFHGSREIVTQSD